MQGAGRKGKEKIMQGAGRKGKEKIMQGAGRKEEDHGKFSGTQGVG